MHSLVEVRHVSKYYGKTKVLDDVSFTVGEREIIGLIGPNGAGKSTLMKCMNSRVFFQEGDILIEGFSIKTNREKALQAQSSLIENPGMYLDMTGEQNLKFFARLRKTDAVQYARVMEFTGLKEALKKKSGQYSLGMKQRLGLGIALLAKPRFLILDEPMNGLDPDGVMLLRDNLKKLVEEQAMSILISSHQLGEIEKIATRILCIDKGKIITSQVSLLNRKQYILETEQLQKLSALSVMQRTAVAYRALNDTHIMVEFLSMDGLQRLLSAAQDAGIRITDVQQRVIDMEEFYRQVFGRTS